VLNFFKTSARNILTAEEAAGVQHHIALSVVGADRLPDSGYMRAKVAQEAAIQAAAVPYTIVRATQFFEFIGAIADGSTVDGTIRLPPALMQPIAAEDIATALADIAVQPPQNGIIEVAGAEPIRMDAIVRQLLTAKHDPRQVVTDPEARYFGAVVNDQSITPGDAPRTTATRFEDWLRQSTP
jgi:uncharacterized protein YbjT (DUF2867 family)